MAKIVLLLFFPVILSLLNNFDTHTHKHWISIEREWHSHATSHNTNTNSYTRTQFPSTQVGTLLSYCYTMQSTFTKLYSLFLPVSGSLWPYKASTSLMLDIESFNLNVKPIFSCSPTASLTILLEFQSHCLLSHSHTHTFSLPHTYFHSIHIYL